MLQINKVELDRSIFQHKLLHVWVSLEHYTFCLGSRTYKFRQTLEDGPKPFCCPKCRLAWSKGKLWNRFRAAGWNVLMSKALVYTYVAFIICILLYTAYLAVVILNLPSATAGRMLFSSPDVDYDTDKWMLRKRMAYCLMQLICVSACF